jgi:hypothetical protein
VKIENIDVTCSNCNALAGVPCRPWQHFLTSLGQRSHRARVQRRKDVEKLHRLATFLFFTEWPSREEVESIARLGADDDDRQRAGMFLDLVDRTGYDGELFA